MGTYQVLSAPEGTEGYNSSAGDQISQAIGMIAGMVAKNKRKSALKEKLSSGGYEPSYTIDQKGNVSTTYKKPSLSIKEQIANTLGVGSMTKDQMHEAAQTDPLFQAISGVDSKEDKKTRTEQLEEDIQSAAEGSSKWGDVVKRYPTSADKIKEARLNTLDKGTKEIIKVMEGDIGTAYSEKGMLEQILKKSGKLKKEGYNVEAIIDYYKDRISELNLVDRVPTEYQHLIAGGDAPAKKKKFDWSSLFSAASPVSAGGSVAERFAR